MLINILFITASSNAVMANELKKQPESFLGQPITIIATEPGKYSGYYHYHLEHFLNREHTESQTIEGSISLNLFSSNQVSLCLHYWSTYNSNRSKYITADGKKHTYDNEDERFIAYSGKMQSNGQLMQLKQSGNRDESCEKIKPFNVEDAVNVELNCFTLQADEHFPVRTLACQLLNKDYHLEKVAFNPEAIPDALPYYIYNLKRQKKRIKPAMTAEPWLIMGKNRGLKIIYNERFRKPASFTIEPFLDPVDK
jgi:hypothetical protein